MNRQLLTPDDLQAEHEKETPPMTIQSPPPPPKRKSAPRPRDTQPAASGDDPWDRVEDALNRIAFSEASSSDYSTVAAAGLRDDTLKAELRRVRRVADEKTRCGTWQQVEGLEQEAEVIATTAGMETKLLQDEIDELTRRNSAKIRELDGQVQDASGRAAAMRHANQTLRTLVPEHVRRYADVVSAQANESIGARFNDLNNQIGPMRNVMAVDAQPIRLDVGRANFQSAAVYDLRRTLRGMGHTFADDQQMAAELPEIQGRCRTELPKLESDLEVVEQEREQATADALGSLDCYLPRE